MPLALAASLLCVILLQQQISQHMRESRGFERREQGKRAEGEKAREVGGVNQNVNSSTLCACQSEDDGEALPLPIILALFAALLAALLVTAAGRCTWSPHARLQGIFDISCG